MADGRDWVCTSCTREYGMKKLYGMDLAQYDVLLAAQGGGCALCGVVKYGRGYAFQVDHDHSTGRVRGLLCATCNMQLGIYESFITKPNLQEYINRGK